MCDSQRQVEASDGVVPKIVGSDVELGNSIAYDDGRVDDRSCAEASRLLLAQVRGYRRPVCGGGSDSGWHTGWESASDGYREHEQDRGRKFLTNGSCVYTDLDHLEICSVEVASAFDHVAAARAMLLIARDAMIRANAELPEGRTIKVLANNSDGFGNSYGSHLNVLLTRRCYENLFRRKMHYLQWLATYQVASIILTGAGKVGAENGRAAADYQISSRADFFEVLLGIQTTMRRPICNCRDESLANEDRLARAHVIFFDHTMPDVARMLQAGMTQIVMAMIEQEQVPHELVADPVEAVQVWSRDPDLNAQVAMVDGSSATAVNVLQTVFDHAQRFVEAGRADGLVPEARRIISIWGECLQKARQRDWDFLSSRVGWVAKRIVLSRAAQKRNLPWDSPEMKYLDQIWASLDPAEGIYAAIERSGAMQRLVSDAEIEYFVHEPPDNTRAWLRAHLIRMNESCPVSDVDWDFVRVQADPYTPAFAFRLSNPAGCTRAIYGPMLDDASSPGDFVRRLADRASRFH